MYGWVVQALSEKCKQERPKVQSTVNQDQFWEPKIMFGNIYACASKASSGHKNDQFYNKCLSTFMPMHLKHLVVTKMIDFVAGKT